MNQRSPTTIVLPFLSRFMDPLWDGRKTMTCRTRVYGASGDTFVAFNTLFKISSVDKMKLGDVARNFYKEEGVASVDEFQAVWTALHPRAGFKPEQEVWVHSFGKVEIVK